MIAIVHSIYSQSVHAPASHARLMDNEAERYCILCIHHVIFYYFLYSYMDCESAINIYKPIHQYTYALYT